MAEMTEAEHERRFPRHPVGLRVRLKDASGEIEATTRTVSREGMSVRLPRPLEPGMCLDVYLHLPEGDSVVTARAECRNSQGEEVCGFALAFDDDAQRACWEAFIDQEEATGSLWRMIGRYATTSGSEKETVRSVLERGRLGVLFKKLSLADKQDTDRDVVLKLHTVGENGEAYRVCFEKHPSRPGIESDLCRRYRGFKELAKGAVGRVLDGAVMVRFHESQPVVPVRVCELSRGGFAYVAGGEHVPASLVSLCVGELLLVEMDGKSVFPHFDDDELERVACDTFRSDIPKPVFKATQPERKAERNAPGFEHNDVSTREIRVEGVEVIRRAQAAAERVETRVYGDRVIQLFPEVWARARDGDGHELMGPTMQDGDRTLLLALVGPGAPRVLRLRPDEHVTLLGGAPGGLALPPSS